MNNTRCLYCYLPLDPGTSDYHSRCSRKFYNKAIPPLLPYTEAEMQELALKVVRSQSTVTGVQPKLSLGIENNADKQFPEKLTIVGLWGDYILKPPAKHYPHLPEVEDLSMHLARLAGITTVPHSLIRLKSGELAYITRRIDRANGKKFHMEDMCQLTERLTEQKYRGSYEQIGKAIVKFAVNPGLDIINFFEQVVFCFLIGNNDMHLKNFSLFKDPVLNYQLCPAYDLVASALMVEGDDEEMALTLNGKKKKIKRQDFEVAMSHFGLEERALKNIFTRVQKVIPKWHAFIDTSFVPDSLKDNYHKLIHERAQQLGMNIA